MKAGVLLVKEIPGFRIVGERDAEGGYSSVCSCGHSYWGFADYWKMRTWISSHAARHTLKIAAKA